MFSKHLICYFVYRIDERMESEANFILIHIFIILRALSMSITILIWLVGHQKTSAPPSSSLVRWSEDAHSNCSEHAGIEKCKARHPAPEARKSGLFLFPHKTHPYFFLHPRRNYTFSPGTTWNLTIHRTLLYIVCTQRIYSTA